MTDHEPIRLDDEQVYVKYADELMRFATGLVGPTEAEDVVADAVARCLRSRSWNEVSNQRAYLYRAVLNETHSLGRRRARRRVYPIDEPTTVEPLIAPEVRAAVDRLSVRQRAVVLLTYWADLDPGTVAERLGISEGSVRRHLARARARLREVLDADTLDDRLATLAQRLVADAPPAPRFAEIERRRPPRRMAAHVAPLLAVAAVIGLIAGLVALVDRPSGPQRFSLAPSPADDAGPSVGPPLPVPGYVPDGLSLDYADLSGAPVNPGSGPLITVVTGRPVGSSRWSAIVGLNVSERPNPVPPDLGEPAISREVEGRSVTVESWFPGHRRMYWNEAERWFELNGFRDESQAAEVIRAIQVDGDELTLRLPEGREVIGSAVWPGGVPSAGTLRSAVLGYSRDDDPIASQVLEISGQGAVGDLMNYAVMPGTVEAESLRFEGHPALLITFERADPELVGLPERGRILLWSPEPGTAVGVGGPLSEAEIRRVASSLEFVDDADEWQRRVDALKRGG